MSMKGFTFCVTVKTSNLEWLVQYERTVAVVKLMISII